MVLKYKNLKTHYTLALPPEKHNAMKRFLIKLYLYANSLPAGEKVNVSVFIENYRKENAM